MEIYRMQAPPYFWSDEVRVYKLCGNAHSIKISCDTESMAPSTFSVRVHLPTLFNPIEFIGPGSKVIDLPESCFDVKVSLKSHLTGQMVLCQVN